MSREGPQGCETCREPGLLLWLGAGTLEASERLRILESAERCPICRLRLAENDALASAVRAAGPSAATPPLSPQALVRISQAPPDERVLASLSPDDRALVDVLRAVDADLEARERRPPWREWLSGLLGAIVPPQGAGLVSWLRSPAVAYLVVVALAYPAYLGWMTGPPRDERTPIVLSTPLGIDSTGANRGTERPAITVESQGGPTVVTVFVPVDERYRYRLEILDADGRSLFRRDDAKSFDGYGTFALMLPEGFLAPGDHELRVDELGEDGRSIEVFSFPFEVQR